MDVLDAPEQKGPMGRAFLNNSLNQVTSVSLLLRSTGTPRDLPGTGMGIRLR